MVPTLNFDRLRSILVATVRHLPERRTRAKWIYALGDAVLGAFAVCFVQSPSFLAHQRAMQRRQGQNNAPSLFGIDQVPSAPQIRNLLARSRPSNWRRPSGGSSSSCATAIIWRGIKVTSAAGYAPWRAHSTSVPSRFIVRHVRCEWSMIARTTATRW